MRHLPLPTWGDPFAESDEWEGLTIRYPPPWDYRVVIHVVADPDELLWERVKTDPEGAFIGLQDAGMLGAHPHESYKEPTPKRVRNRPDGLDLPVGQRVGKDGYY